MIGVTEGLMVKARRERDKSCTGGRKAWLRRD